MDNARKEINKLALAACDADAAARELLKPTDEERVRETICELRMTERHETATLLESLLSENKALRAALSNMVEDGDKTDREVAMRLLGWGK